jgi:hypothetical protein
MIEFLIVYAVAVGLLALLCWLGILLAKGV